MTDNCSNSFSALYVFQAFTVLKPTSKIVARNKNGDAIKLRLVVAKGWGLQSIQTSIQQDSKDFPTQRLCKTEYYYYFYKSNTFLDFVTMVLWGCPWSCSWSCSLSLPPDVVKRLSPMLFPRLSLRSHRGCLQGCLRGLAPKLTSRWPQMVPRQFALPVCLARLFPTLLLSLPLSFLSAVVSRLFLMLRCTEVVLKVVPQVDF